MGEGIEGQAGAIRDLALAMQALRAIERDLIRMYWEHWRRVWLMRMLVLLNVTICMWDLVDAQAWVQTMALLPAWGAWHSFMASERFAGDLPCMRAKLAEVREKTKTVERQCNES